MTFTGFDAADFDAFQPKKQGSNAYTLERRRAKDKVLAVARALAESDPERVKGWELEVTEDAPSMANGRKVRGLAAYFVRPAAVRSGLKELLATNLSATAHLFEIAVHQQHAHLEIRIEEPDLEIGVQIPATARVDRENLARKLALDWAREDFIEHLGTLPAATEVGFEGDRVAAGEVDDAALRGWAEALPTRDAGWSVELRVDRNDPALAEPAWLGAGAEIMGRFADTLRFVAWAKENDHSPVEEAVAKTVEAAKASTALQPGARVTILGGLFAGRGGYVAEIDGKGKAKVMVGPVTVTVDADELKPAG